MSLNPLLTNRSPAETLFTATGGGGGGGGGGANPSFSTITVEGPSVFTPAGPGTQSTTSFVVSSIGGGITNILTSPSTVGVYEQWRQADANGVVDYIGLIGLDNNPRQMRIAYNDSTAGSPGTQKGFITIVSSINNAAGGIQMGDQGGADTLTIANGDINIFSANSRVKGSAGVLPQLSIVAPPVASYDVPGGGGVNRLFSVSTVQGRTYRFEAQASLYNPGTDSVSWLGLHAEPSLNEQYFQYATNAFISTQTAGPANPPAGCLTCLYGAPSSYVSFAALNGSASASTTVSVSGFTMELID